MYIYRRDLPVDVSDPADLLAFYKTEPPTKDWYEGYRKSNPCFDSYLLAGFKRIGRLEEEFESVRAIFFPRWKEGDYWRLEVGFSPENGGGLRYADQTIIVSFDMGPFLTSTLIHEICHAICEKPRPSGTFTSHGKRWRDRMEKAALLAEARGDDELAEALRSDYGAYDPYSEYYEW